MALAVAADGGVSLAGGPGAYTLVDAGTALGTPSPRALGGVIGGQSGAVFATGFGGYDGGTDDRLYNDVWFNSVAS